MPVKFVNLYTFESKFAMTVCLREPLNGDYMYKVKSQVHLYIYF